MAYSAPTRAYFFGRFPEFAGVDGTFVDNCLADAVENVNAEVFQSQVRYSRAVCLHTAIMLYRSPKGRAMRAADNDGQVYQWEYELDQLNASATIGLRVF